MKIRIDSDEFQKRQLQLLDLLAREIRFTLEEEGLSQERIRKTTESLTFRISTIIDTSRIMDIEGKRLRPFLTFADDYAGLELVAENGGTCLHDMTYEIVEKIFQDKPSA